MSDAGTNGDSLHCLVGRWNRIRDSLSGKSRASRYAEARLYGLFAHEEEEPRAARIVRHGTEGQRGGLWSRDLWRRIYAIHREDNLFSPNDKDQARL